MPNLGGAIGRSCGKIVSSCTDHEVRDIKVRFVDSMKVVQDTLGGLSDNGYKVTRVKRGQNQMRWYDPALLHGYVLLRLQRPKYAANGLDFDDVQVGDMVRMMDDFQAVLEANRAAGISSEFDLLREHLVGVEMRVNKKDAGDMTIECDVPEHGWMWFAASALRSAEGKYCRLDWTQDGVHLQVADCEAGCVRYLRQRAKLRPQLSSHVPPMTSASCLTGMASMKSQAVPASVLPATVMTAQPVLPLAGKVAVAPGIEIAKSGLGTALKTAMPLMPVASVGTLWAPPSAALLESMMMPAVAIEGGLCSSLPWGAATVATVCPLALAILSSACQISALAERYVPVSDSNSSLQLLIFFLQQLIDDERFYSPSDWNCNHFADQVLRDLVDPCLFARRI
eukprot:TRINITY_DN90436_c0_g1_i1.p1 TRINITY_DN90436_c0_g1~~TRINITY_DN90436_c0_g1_i1.p1  ORF type:complete len:396 (-),score=51.84 TRINITY_DN90436_c0_g1_i1:25-1212(-)